MRHPNPAVPAHIHIGQLRPVCPFCGQRTTAAELNAGGLLFPRIGGDSANGYESVHRACLPQD